MSSGQLSPLKLTSWLSSACPLLAALCLFVLLLSTTLGGLFHCWEGNPDYAHGWLLVPALAWLTYRVKPWLGSGEPQQALGTVTMLSGGLVHLLALVIPWPLIDYAGWVLMVRGLLLACWGREAAQRAMPLLAFSILLFPLPVHWLNQVALLLQDVIARVASGCLSLIWVCHRRGQFLYLAGMEEPLSVAAECSGVRQILVFVALAWSMALVLRAPSWKRVLFVLTAVPLAILANVARVLALAVIARLAGPHAIEGPLHEMPMLVTLPVGALLLWLLFQRWRNRAMVEAQPVGAWAWPSSWWPAFTMVTLLGMQVLLQHHLSADQLQTTVTTIELEKLPSQLGSWAGTPHPEARRVAEQASFADATLLRAYQNQQGLSAAVYLVYSGTGRDRLHHPEICLRDAAGAVAVPTGERNVPLQKGDPRTAHRFCFQRARQQQITVYYWHYTMLPAASPTQSLLQRMHSLQQEQWPSLTVQVQINRADEATWQALEANLLPEVDHWLRTQLPASTQTGSERLPLRMTWQR